MEKGVGLYNELGSTGNLHFFSENLYPKQTNWLSSPHFKLS